MVAGPIDLERGEERRAHVHIYISLEHVLYFFQANSEGCNRKWTEEDDQALNLKVSKY